MEVCVQKGIEELDYQGLILLMEGKEDLIYFGKEDSSRERVLRCFKRRYPVGCWKVVIYDVMKA